MICVEKYKYNYEYICCAFFTGSCLNISVLPDPCGVCKGRHAESASFREERISFDKGMTQ